MSTSNKLPLADYRLKNINNALYVDGSNDIVMRTGFAGNIVISGNVNVPGTINVASSPTDPVHVHLTEVGTFGNLTTFVPVQGNIIVTGGNANVTVVGNIAGITTLPSVTGNVHVWGNVAVDNFPSNVSITQMPGVTGNVGVSGNVSITQLPALGNVSITQMPGIAVTSMPEVEIKNDTDNPIPVTGNVTATIGSVITVITTEDAGDKYSFNNHAANTNRGWTMDEVMRPVVSFQNASANAADIIKILEYEIGNNNANQSTIVYEWYEGPLTISGAAIPAWTTFGVHSQYRVYQDKYSSNAGNTFTVPAGTYMRHSGIIIGKNTSGDEGPANLHGGGSPNMLTLCMRRVDNATKLDVWFAFTIKELA